MKSEALFHERLKNPEAISGKSLQTKFVTLQTYHSLIQYLVNNKKTLATIANLEKEFQLQARNIGTISTQVNLPRGNNMKTAF